MIKKKSKTIFAIVLMAVMTVGISWELSRRDQVRYKGRSPEQWLGEVFVDRTNALHAFDEMGPAAFPDLLRILKERGTTKFSSYSAWAYDHLPEIWQNPHWRPISLDDKWDAIEEVLLNSPDTKIIFPELLKMYADQNSPTRYYVISSVRKWAAPSDNYYLHVLTVCLTDPNPGIRSSSACLLMDMGPAARPAISALTETLQDQTGMVRVSAAAALWRIDGQTNGVVQILRDALGRRPTRDELETRNKLDISRLSMADILNEIDPADQSLIPVFVNALIGSDANTSLDAMTKLGKYGPAAISGVPELKQLINTTTSTELRNHALDSLKMIDPEAAAKYEMK